MRASPSRRDLLRTLGALGLGTLVRTDPVLAQMAATLPCSVPDAAGAVIGTRPLFRGRLTEQIIGRKYGDGLDARLVTDLSLLTPDNLITPNDLAYIRSEIPPAAAAHTGPWAIRAARRPGIPELTAENLAREARPMGPHLFECSGNANPANFGLMSVANWDGVPLAAVLSRLEPPAGATAVLVGGVDHEAAPSKRSIPGASWVFPLSALDDLAPFLATRMNGEALPPDHGAPVRLVVPGWYGCTWIKWVDEIRFVGQDEPATTQMLEFAGRTHQSDLHPLARQYAPADIQTAATAVRVEKRRHEGGIVYRIVGIVWGGTDVVERLAIRFSADGAWQWFSICPKPATHTMWSLWDYLWKPPAPGVYDIALRADPAIPQRRLDRGYYMRQVHIDEV